MMLRGNWESNPKTMDADTHTFSDGGCNFEQQKIIIAYNA